MTAPKEPAEGQAQGRIFQNKNRKVWMLAYCGPRPDGTWGEIRESAKTRSEPRARRILARRLRQVANHKEGLADFEGPSQRRVLISELLVDLFEEYRRREIKGLDRVWYRIRKGSPLEVGLGSRRVDRLTSDQVVAYTAARRQAGRSKATVNRDVELLGAALRLALQRGKIIRAPRMPAKLSEKDNVRKTFFERTELEALLPHLPEPLDDMARFGFATGWRRGELLNLTWEAVSKDEVRLGTTKNGQPRSLPLDAELKKLIERRRKAREYKTPSGVGLSAYVFHRNGKPLARNTFGKQWRRACVKAGLGRRVKNEKGVLCYEGKSFHDFRRTAARNMIRAGVPQSIAMRVVGHETDAMFNRYDITDNRDKLGALEAARKFVEQQPREKPSLVRIAAGSSSAATRV
jgi:integrase